MPRKKPTKIIKSEVKAKPISKVKKTTKAKVIKAKPSKTKAPSVKAKPTKPKKAVNTPPKDSIQPTVITTPSRKKPKNLDNFVRVSTNSKQTKFVEMGLRVQRGEVKWSRYIVEDSIGYHYYLILKK